MINRHLIGARVREARELAGLTQAKLAAAADVTSETISRMERGAYDPALATLVAVADELDAGLDFLVGRSDGRGKGKQSALTTTLIKQVGSLSVGAQRAVLKIVDLL